MKRSSFCAAILLVSACSSGDRGAVPSGTFIELIEQKLAAHPCIGDLGQWERSYRFARPTGFSAYTSHGDLDVIEFHLRRAGDTTIRPGRILLARGDRDDWPDGASIRSIDGRFKLGDNSLRLSRCTPLKGR